MVYPAGIVIDEDGFVYVCNFSSLYSKVVVFRDDTSVYLLSYLCLCNSCIFM